MLNQFLVFIKVLLPFVDTIANLIHLIPEFNQLGRDHYILGMYPQIYQIRCMDDPTHRNTTTLLIRWSLIPAYELVEAIQGLEEDI